jgi:uncharacterized protein YwgA
MARTCVRMFRSVRWPRHPVANVARIIVACRARISAMSRRDWLLVLCAYQGAPRGLDPVRIQKGMFLFSRSGTRPSAQHYDFRPYDYGPMSPQIYKDLDALVQVGLLEARAVPGKQWARYVATARGRRVAAERLKVRTSAEDKASAQRLFEIKRSIADVSFNELLQRVYDEHPDMAVNSVFPQRHWTRAGRAFARSRAWSIARTSTNSCLHGSRRTSGSRSLCMCIRKVASCGLRTRSTPAAPRRSPAPGLSSPR